MNSSVIKISNSFYCDERDISGVYKMDGKPWTACVIIKGVSVFTDTPFEDIIETIHWNRFIGSGYDSKEAP